MDEQLLSLLQCPICSTPMSEVGASLKCKNNHSFDHAKQGYYNLLPVQHKASKEPGDDKQMVQARREFLQLGYYQPFSDAINQLVLTKLANKAKPNVLDAGCGEGYYLRTLLSEAKSQDRQANFIGIDISKPAVISASKSAKQPLWLVASAAKAPSPNKAFDCIFSLFTPLNGPELHRLIKSDGLLITATSGPSHLIELRQILYPDVNQKPVATSEQLADLFTLEEQHNLSFSIRLDSQEHIDALVKMTPHYWRSTNEAKTELSQLTELEVTTEFHIQVFRPKAITTQAET